MSLSAHAVRRWRIGILSIYVGMMLALAVATILEKGEGTDYVMLHVYHARWFIAGWAALAVATVALVATRWRHCSWPVLVLHGAFVVILLGAFVTFSSARRGLVHLPVKTPVGEYLSEATGRYHRLPFTLQLDSFRIAYADDGMSPTDYVSYLTVDGVPQRVSMNRVLEVRGIRLYQSSYDEEVEGSWLSLNCDPWGIPLTYTGYALLGIALLAPLFRRRRKRGVKIATDAAETPHIAVEAQHIAVETPHVALSPTARWGGRAAALFLLVLVVRFFLRWAAAGYIPMSNGYETLQLVAVGLLTTGLACRRRYPSMVWGTVAAALVIVGVAHSPSDSDAIQPLAPVLRSPLLVVHVLLVVVAYALLAVLWVNALLALTRRGEEALQRHALLTRRLLLPAVSFLAAGIFVGAVWANLSWGRYWGWDPKEVWALITLMLYALPLHSALLPAFRRPHVLHVFMALAFLAVLATYFGVNYLLGGMHSYAG